MINVRFQRKSASVQSDHFADVQQPYNLNRHTIRNKQNISLTGVSKHSEGRGKESKNMIYLMMEYVFLSHHSVLCAAAGGQ